MKRISIANPVFNGNEKKYLDECIDTGWISSAGRFVTEFEKSFAQFCGTKYALTCANGTVSLHLSLIALGIGKDDEVIIPTLTYIATANTVKYCGATPVFVDSEMDTWNVDPSKIEEKVTSKTKAIMVAHLYGQSTNMDPILEIAKKHNLYVIEDAAEAHGATYNGKKVGSMGDVGSFSFFGNKIITTGEGGMIVTDNKELYEKMKFLRSQGMDPNKRYWHTVIAYNYRMTNMQAAVGLAQLENIEWHLSERKRVSGLYKKYLGELKEYIEIPKEMDWGKHVYWMYSIILKENIKIERDLFMDNMEKNGIEMRPLFYPMHTMPPYYEENGDYPVANYLGSRGINLPTHSLLTEEDIKFIVSSIKKNIMSNL